MNPAFHWLCWRRDISNFAMLKYRDFDAYLITMQHAGTHWLKFMMSTAIAHQYGLEPPQFIHNASSNDFIGHPKHPRIHTQTPRIASSHSIPHAWFDSRLVRSLIKFPPNVVLLRDLRAALVSNFEKWKDKYACGFSEYLHGDLKGKRFNFDLWTGMHFYNRWGRVQQRFPNSIYVTTYERLGADPRSEIERIFRHLKIDIDESHIESAIHLGSKTNMSTMLDPDEPVKNIVRQNDADPRTWFDQQDRSFFDATIATQLKNSFGYEFDW